jgi:hypothetical protein
MLQKNEVLTLCAYHEAGRVLFAYKCGYTCSSIKVSGKDAGAGVSSLNGGDDTPYIQAIFSGNLGDAILQQSPAKAEEVAKKLMKLYCAGNCAELFYSKNGNTDEIDEISLRAPDMKYIEILQDYLQASVPGHTDDYPTKTILGIFEELVNVEIWKPIKTLAEVIINNGGGTIERFKIEDSIMRGGFKPTVRRTRSSLQLTEGDTRAKEPEIKLVDEVSSGEEDGSENTSGEEQQESKSLGADSVGEETAATPDSNQNRSLDEDKLLNFVLKDFLRRIKTDWDSEDLNGAVDYLKQVFKEYYE